MAWQVPLEIPWLDGAVKYRLFVDSAAADPPEVDAKQNAPTPVVLLVPNQEDSEAVIQSRAVYADGHVGPLSEPLKVTGLVTPVKPPSDPEPPSPSPLPNTIKWQGYRDDPAGFAKGWFDIFWDIKRQRVINLFGHSHNPAGDNSVRAFYPLTNTWEILYPSNGGTRGMQNRDNYVAWIVDDELFVTGGSTGQNFGIFNLVTKDWDYVGTGEDLMENFSTWGRSLGGHGYSAELKKFVTYYPVESQPTVGWFHVLEPGTTKRFKHSALPMPTAFGSRKETHNAGVVAGKYFYLYGGRPTNTLNDTKDFWRCDLQTFAWQRLADAPWAVYQPTLTYDSVNNCLVLHGGAFNFVPSRNTAIFDLQSEAWTDVTATQELFDGWQSKRPHQNRLQASCYAPAPINRHFYTGGINRNDGGSDSWTLSRVVDGLNLGSKENIEMPKTLTLDALEITNVPEGSWTVEIIVKKDGVKVGSAESDPKPVAADPPAEPVIEKPVITVG